jgi:hypothetical protein
MTPREELEALRRLAELEGKASGSPMAQPAAQPAAQPLSRTERFARGLRDPLDGGAQLLTKVLPDGVVNAGNRFNNWLADKTGLVARLPEGGVDQQVREAEAEYQARRTPHTLSSLITGQKQDPGFDWMRLAGNVINPANLAAAARLPAATTLAGRVGVGALGGGLSALSQPVTQGDNFAEEKAKQVALGAAFGGAVPVAVAGAGRIISPKASQDAQLALLRSSGVRPTVGQTLGGWANKVEERAQSLPIVGDAISSARARAVDQLNLAAINRATAPIGVKVDKIGQEGIKEAGDALSGAYDDVLTGLKSIRFDQQWSKDYGQLKQMAKSLPEGVRGTFTGKVKSLIDARISKAGGMTAETMKQLDSELGDAARRYGRSSVASEQELSDAFLQVQSLLRAQVGRNSPQAAERLKALDTGWANLVRVEKAGAAAINSDGVFSPAQLNNAIKAADSSARKRGVARGTALMQDLGGAGGRLGNKVPNSGTADRLMLGGAGLGAYFVNPAIPAGLLSGAALYSRPGQSLLTGLAASRPQGAQAVAGMLNKSAPMFAPAGGLLALDGLDY